MTLSIQLALFRYVKGLSVKLTFNACWKFIKIFFVIYFLFFAKLSFAQCTDPVNISYQDTCYGEATRFTATAYGDPNDWKWEFDDPASGRSDSARGASVSHVFTKGNTNYQVKFSFPNSCGDTTTITQTVNIVSPQPIDIPSLKDTVICDTPYVMNAGIGASYLWSTGQTTQTISNANAGKYWVRIFDNGCFADTFELRVWGQGNKGNYNWLFGFNAGLDFSDEPPSIINNSQSNTIGGAAAISDPLGNLLFYTDGKNVYDKNNSLMEGGEDLSIETDTSQKVLIVPDPRSNNRFYVFTTSVTNGLSYSVVDLSFNNGLGRVIASDNFLIAPVSEMIAGVKNPDNGQFWVVTHGINNNQFIAYKIADNGLQSTTVVSNAGAILTGNAGNIKFSEDGTLAAVSKPDNNRVEIFSFDQATGQFTLQDTITNLTSPFGLEFSSDNSKLYVTTLGASGSSLYQYDLSAGNDSLIMASQKDLSSGPGVVYGALQMGPDQRIYVAIANSNSLGVIENPDEDSTTIAYTYPGIALGSGTSGLGLTNFVANHFQTTSWAIQYMNICTGTITRFRATAPDTVYYWIWNFGDGTVVTANDTISHQYASAGDYNVSATAHYPCGDTTLNIQLTIYETPELTLNDTTVCRAGQIQLHSGGEANYLYQWSTGGNQSFITTDTSGFYSVIASNNVCIDTASANVVFSPVTPFDLGPDQTLCQGDSILLNTQNPGLTNTWSNGATQSTVTIKNSGNYSVTVSNGPICSITDNININFIIPPNVSIGDSDSIVCVGQTVTLDAGSHSGFSYLWSTNNTNQQIQAVTSGVYGVIVYQGNCSSGDTVNIIFDPGPSISLPPRFVICSDNGDVVELNPGTAASYIWSPGGQTTPAITVNAEGNYSVEAFSANNCPNTASTIVVDICEAVIYIPNIFSPNGDGTNDEFKIAGDNIVQFHLEIFNQWGELIFISKDINESWKGTYRGQLVQEGTFIWKVTYAGETERGIEERTKVGDVTVIR